MVTNAKAAQAVAGRFVLPTTLYGLSTDTNFVVNAFMIMGTTILESNYIATSADGYPVFNQG